MSSLLRTDLSIKEVNSLLDALYDSELLNLHRRRAGHEHKDPKFLREGNEPVNTAFDKLLKLKSYNRIIGDINEQQ